MKTFTAICTLSLLAASPVIVYANDTSPSFSDCLALAPDDQEFAIGLDIKVDTTSRPAKKNGGWQVTNAAGPAISDNEQAAFEPMVKCLKEYMLK